MAGEIAIVEGTPETVVALSKKIPELQNPYPIEEYQKRLNQTAHLILVALMDGQAVGFKVGYAREDYFYSWMGGVLPAFRRRGIARFLADYQENWAKSKGYTTILFKTRNYLKGMLIFAVQNGFDIIGVEHQPDPGNNRILLRKQLIEE